MAMWDFTVDSEIQAELSQHLKEKADAFDAQVKNMYGKVNELSQHWVGEDYDAFKNGTENYSGALQDLSDGIRMYANHFDKIVEGTDTLSTELITIIENMTNVGNVPAENLDGTDGPGIGAIGGAIAGIEGIESTENPNSYHSSGFTEFFSSNDYYKGIGEDFAENYAVDEWYEIPQAIIMGTNRTIVDAAQVVGNVACDGVNDVLEAVEWLITGDYEGYQTSKDMSQGSSGFTNPYNPEFYSTLGDKFGDNFDYSNVNNFFEGAGVTLVGAGQTVMDGLDVLNHAVIDTAQGAVECVEWAWNGICDGLDSFFGWLM